MLEEAAKVMPAPGSLAVYDKEELVAYIRLVGDGHSVIFGGQDPWCNQISQLPCGLKETLEEF